MTARDKQHLCSSYTGWEGFKVESLQKWCNGEAEQEQINRSLYLICARQGTTQNQMAFSCIIPPLTMLTWHRLIGEIWPELLTCYVRVIL